MDKGIALKILNLDVKASFEDAKKAYRDLAKKYHPDVVEKNCSLETNAESKMKDINLAFRYLAPQLRSNKSVKKTKEPPKRKQTSDYNKTENYKKTAKKESAKPENGGTGSMDSIGTKIIESFTKIFFKKESSTRPLKKKLKKEQMIKKRADKVLFEDVFKGVHKGSFPDTGARTKKKQKAGYSNNKDPFDYYQKYMTLKKKMNLDRFCK